MTDKKLRVGILAGESSGDILGAGLMSALKQQHPSIHFEGIGGPLMSALGLSSQVPIDRLSVMGFIAPLKRLPELLRIRKNLIQYFQENPPDVFIGIDYPEFNLSVERSLRRSGITTVHYVSPSIWAWRQKRIHKVAKAVDLVLTLFPFEADIYQRHQVPVSFVGHPLADEISMTTNTESARDALNVKSESKVLALLPGSRQGEVERLSPEFLSAARLCQQQWPGLTILLPCATPSLKVHISRLIQADFTDLNIQLTDGQSRTVMAAADFVLIASGTATLEALLLKKPMVVCYKMGKISYSIISRLLKVPYFSLPNLLAQKKMVEELVQDQVNANNIFTHIQAYFNSPQSQDVLGVEYGKIHQHLRQNASSKAAQEVLKLIP